MLSALVLACAVLSQEPGMETPPPAEAPPSSDVLVPAEPPAQPAAEPVPETQPAPPPADGAAPPTDGAAPPPPADQPAPRDQNVDEEEDLEAGKRAEPKERGPKLGGNNLLAGVVAGGVACVSIPVLGLFTPLLSVIPVVGSILSLLGPFLIGTGAGTFGWLAGQLAGGKRIPLLGPVLAGLIGVPLTVLFTLPTYAFIIAGYLLTVFGVATTTTGAAASGSDSRTTASLVGGGALLMAAGIALVAIGGIAAGLITTIGYTSTAVAVGLTAGLMGRGKLPMESGVNFDVFSVPSPEEVLREQAEEAEGEEADDEEAAEEEAPRSRQKSAKPARELDPGTESWGD